MDQSLVDDARAAYDYGLSSTSSPSADFSFVDQRAPRQATLPTHQSWFGTPAAAVAPQQAHPFFNRSFSMPQPSNIFPPNDSQRMLEEQHQQMTAALLMHQQQQNWARQQQLQQQPQPIFQQPPQQFEQVRNNERVVTRDTSRSLPICRMSFAFFQCFQCSNSNKITW